MFSCNWDDINFTRKDGSSRLEMIPHVGPPCWKMTIQANFSDPVVSIFRTRNIWAINEFVIRQITLVYISTKNKNKNLNHCLTYILTFFREYIRKYLRNSHSNMNKYFSESVNVFIFFPELSYSLMFQILLLFKFFWLLYHSSFM